MLLDRVVDLVDEGIDVGVHVDTCPIRLIAFDRETRRVVCASPTASSVQARPHRRGSLAHRCVASAASPKATVGRSQPPERRCA
jgi:hypothetical protein